MFWDKISPVYDLFETVYNKKVYTGTGAQVAKLIDPYDEVLECACGTGAISVSIAGKCRKLVATDYSEGMLKQAEAKCRGYYNVTFETADITDLPYKDGRFDKAVAGNVIHLIPNPEKALRELERVVKPGGKIIIPTYINDSTESSRFAVRFIELLGADFKRQFDPESYRKFFEDLGCENAEFITVEGRMPCMIAVIGKK